MARRISIAMTPDRWDAVLRACALTAEVLRVPAFRDSNISIPGSGGRLLSCVAEHAQMDVAGQLAAKVVAADARRTRK